MSNLIRRQALDEACGGLIGLSSYIAEDYFMTIKMHEVKFTERKWPKNCISGWLDFSNVDLSCAAESDQPNDTNILSTNGPLVTSQDKNATR